MELGSLGIMIAFAAAIILGKILGVKVPDIVFRSVVIALVFTISLWAAESGVSILFKSLVTTIAILGLLVFSLVTLGYLFDSNSSQTLKSKPKARPSYSLLAAIIAGWTVGFLYPLVPQTFLQNVVLLEVYLVIAVTGLAVSGDIHFESIKTGGRIALKAVLLSILSALITGLGSSLLLGLPPDVALQIMFGLGWYSFAGPFVAQAYGPMWGFTAFLVNVLREQLTFVLVPLLRKPFLSMISLGGATTMDNTLPVYSYVYGEDASIVSLIHGFILTLLVPFLQGTIRALIL
ncbi:MAG: lysine exporter LysO family protein [Infirmifilum sp.]